LQTLMGATQIATVVSFKIIEKKLIETDS